MNETKLYFLELQKQRNKKRMRLLQEKDEVVHKENKTFRPPYFQISYILHFLFVLNNLKSYGNII